MATITARPRRWDKGSPLSAMRLNETVDALQDVVGQLDPLRKAADESSALRADEDDPTGANPAGIVWTFVSKETRTVRIEDATDDTIYIDVEIATSVQVETDDDRIITIQLEDPADGQ